MRRFLMPALSAALFAGPASVDAVAQQSTTRGFVLGAHFTGASLSIEDGERQNAAGGGVLLGYGFHRRFTLFAQVDGARFGDVPSDDVDGGDWTMGHFDFGVRFNFADAERPWVPFLQASFSERAVRVSDGFFEGSPADEASISGSSFTLGGGIDLYLSEALALDLQLLWSRGDLTRLEVDDVTREGSDPAAESARLNLGIVWWP